MKTQIIHNGKTIDFANLAEMQEFLDNLPTPRGDIEIIGAPKLFVLMNEIGAPTYNWKEINQEICNEWDELFQKIKTDEDLKRTEHKRIGLLDTFKSVMDIAETVIDPDDLEKVKTARDRQYKSFIYQESVVGENICIETLNYVTQREIDSGRMTADNSLRQLAEEGMKSPHLSRSELKNLNSREDNMSTPDKNDNSGFFQKVMKWISGN